MHHNHLQGQERQQDVCSLLLQVCTVFHQASFLPQLLISQDQIQRVMYCSASLQSDELFSTGKIKISFCTSLSFYITVYSVQTKTADVCRPTIHQSDQIQYCEMFFLVGNSGVMTIFTKCCSLELSHSELGQAKPRFKVYT